MKYYCIRQHDITDCGAACLATISKQYGLSISITKIREVAGTDKKGTNAFGIIKAAQELGFTAKAVKGNQEAFFSELPLPAIAHVVVDGKLLHYVVIQKITKKQVIISDPAKGLRKVTPEEFFKEWTGVLIMLVPSETFKKGKDTKNLFERFWNLLIPQKRLILDIFLASIIITVLGIIGALYFQIIIDDILSADIVKTLHIISIGVILLKLFATLLAYIRSQLLIYLGQKLDIALLLGYYDHVLKLPMNFFGTRRVGEIISRFQDASSIRNAISNATLTMMIDSIMAVVGAVILCCKSPILFLIALIIVASYAILVFAFNNGYRKANEKQMEDNAQLTSYLVESLNGIQTVKAFNGELDVQFQTESKFIKLLRSIFNLGHLGNMQSGLKLLISSIGEVAILWVGAYNVIKGNMTIGSLVSFNALLIYFIDPVKNIINLQPTLQTAMVASDRLGEILDLELEKDEREERKIAPSTLKGDIAINNLSFRYGTRKLILEDFSMYIEKGQRVAIVGESGAGKSTIAKILLGFYPYEKGSITIGDYALPDIRLDSLRDKIAYVPQETFLFSDSIMKNLTFGLENPDPEEVIEVAKIARVHEFVNELPLRYETMLDENGANLSGGQRQRIAIARAMLKKPDILILDEATSNLDAVTEKAIQETINAYSQGMTTIIIAHRLSTIRSCDRIFVMEKGKIVEENTHDELMKVKNGYYRTLQESQVGA
ncbi:peptidase domain-containing ABC transporter [Butyrivibrio sp. AE2005]|uniref:peptidase domain-containing ABC transporter n=1 Tax=Butyrivibrio sp. AE2005 TaxID=1496722 RepID=UPI000557FBB8|nr:peptidase domain-containing ABC transporter [Butyrivibrio sp. AE2005]